MKPAAVAKPKAGDARPTVTTANGGMNGFNTAADLLKFNFDDMDEYAPPPPEERKLSKPKEVGSATKKPPSSQTPPAPPTLEDLASPAPKVRGTLAVVWGLALCRAAR